MSFFSWNQAIIIKIVSYNSPFLCFGSGLWADAWKVSKQGVFSGPYFPSTLIYLDIASNIDYGFGLWSFSNHRTIIRTGIACKKIPCHMRNSACRWLIVKKAKIYIYIFLSWVFFHEHSRFVWQQGKGEGICLTPFYHFYPLHRHLDISRAITAESSPLHIACSRTRTANLWFPCVSFR